MNVACMNEGVIIVNKWKTVNQVADETGIPAETVRRYVRQYKDYLLTDRGERRSYLIHETSIDAIKRIRHLLDHGHQKAQIEEMLQQTETITIQSDNEEMNSYLQTLPDLQKNMFERIEQLIEQNEKQAQGIGLLVEQNNEQARNIELLAEHNAKQSQRIESLTKQVEKQQQYIEERDRKLMNALDKIVKDKQAKKGFLSRLFKK